MNRQPALAHPDAKTDKVVSASVGAPGDVRIIPLIDIHPSPENDELYTPFNPADPVDASLAKSIGREGVLDPLVLSLDGYILPGHRRYGAAKLAGLSEVPCRFHDVRRTDDRHGFVRMLREYNRQREKTRAEKLREAIVETDPKEAYRSLIEHRAQCAKVAVAPMQLSAVKRRKAISAARAPFLAAVRKVIHGADYKSRWPLSDRQIHYALLNSPPLIHASKRKSRYANDKASYHALTDLLTRGRLDGSIPMEAISDETRPVTLWQVSREPGVFMQEQIGTFLKGYWRDLMQSQANHVELLGEKNTVRNILQGVAGKYCIPLTTGRGYCSLPPRNDIATRFRKSGKQKLVLLIVSDLDPDGEEIASSFARSMRDDFGIADVHGVKIALTTAQVQKFQIPPGMKAKETSRHHKKFVAGHGENAYELEALKPEQLEQVVTEAIDSVIDRAAFNAELEAEAQDARFLDAARKTVAGTLEGIDFAPGKDP